MPNFTGSEKITLQPGDIDLGYSFEVSVCSSSSANDGTISYGTTVSGISVTSFKTADSDGKTLAAGKTEVSDLISGTPTVAANIISVLLEYPNTNKAGYYKLKFLCTLDSGAIKELDFNRIVVEDL